MNKRKLHLCAVFAALLIIGLASTDAQAQDDDEAARQKAKAAMKGDKTGSNPINFTHDFRVYNEYQWLNTPGDSNQNITTLEFRTPFSKGKWQFRMRGRYQSLNIDRNDDGIDEVDDSGIGDFDFRFLTVPILNMKKKRAVAVGFETFLPTATEDSLGSGALSFGPQVFAVFFAPLGIKGTLIAPAYQHKFSIDEDPGRSDVHQGLIDIYLLWISSGRQYWVLLDPQIILDYEQQIEYMIFDAEAGTMLDKFFGTKGHSAYVRPAFGKGLPDNFIPFISGSDRPIDGSIEVGYKIIW